MLSKNLSREIRALHLKKNRDTQKLFIAEGAKTVTEILEQRPDIVKTVFAMPQVFPKISQTLKKHNAQVIEVSEEDLRHISLQNNPHLVLAVCAHFTVPPRTGSRPPFTLYLDEIRDPGNLGTIIRLCDWFGSRRLFCSEGCCELYNPKVIQSSMGAFLRVSVEYGSLESVLEKNQYSEVYGALLEGKNLYSEILKPGLVIVGNEANGISPANQGKIKIPLTIPSHKDNGSESLNAAMAAAIIASEMFRQNGC